jgi:hypothetical protein
VKLVLFALLAAVAACGGKKSGTTTTSSGTGSAQVTPDPKPSTGSDGTSEKSAPEEDPCAVPH